MKKEVKDILEKRLIDIVVALVFHVQGGFEGVEPTLSSDEAIDELFKLFLEFEQGNLK